MAYSRWGSSCWYTYWSTSGTEANSEPTLCVNIDNYHPISEIRSPKEEILDRYRQDRFRRSPANYYGEGEAPQDRFTEDEIQELSEIMNSFIEDCDREKLEQEALKGGDDE